MAGPKKRNGPASGKSSDFETFNDSDGAVTVYNKKTYETEGKRRSEASKREYPSYADVLTEKFERGNSANADARVTKGSSDPSRTYSGLRKRARKDDADFQFFKHTTKGK